MDNQIEKTAVPKEYHSKSKKEIINDIIKILADNRLSITDSKSLLYETSKEIYRQPVVIVDDHIKQIYRMRNTGEIK